MFLAEKYFCLCCTYLDIIRLTESCEGLLDYVFDYRVHYLINRELDGIMQILLII